MKKDVHKSKNIIPYKALFIICIFIIIILFFLFSYNYFDNKSILSGKVVLDISEPRNCSDSAIKPIWDSVFKESSASITIYSNTSRSDKCELYFANKTVGSKTYLLGGGEFNFFGNVYLIVGLAGEFTPEFSNYLSRFNNSNLNTLNLTNISDYANPRSITSINSANLSFISNFKFQSGNWSINVTENGTFFEFAENYTSSNTARNVIGIVSANKSLDSTFYTKIVLPCTPSWRAVEDLCGSNELKNLWYNDTNACGLNEGRPSNFSLRCDHDRNGIIGNITTINRVNINLGIKINKTVFNLTKLYNETNIVEITDEQVTRVSFVYNFAEKPIDLYNITIIKQNSSDKLGYIIVNGLNNIEKNLTIDKLNNDSSEVCVFDGYVPNIQFISSGCNRTGETILPCPGRKSSYKCFEINNNFIITGLTHSAVREIGSTNFNVCIPNWSCTNWSQCRLNNQTRTCVDLNSCGTNASRPILIQSCIDSSCVSNWTNCTQWAPAECVLGTNQTRNCSDINKCTSESRIEKRLCKVESKSSNISKIIIVFVLGIVALAIIGVIFYLLSRKEDSEQGVLVLSQDNLGSDNVPRQGI